jgi:Glyoxalase-like domain
MTVRIRTITFDCANPYLLAGFWSQVTGYREDPGNSNHPEDPEGLLVAPDGSASLLFVRVPEAKRVKNRVHLDLTPADSSPTWCVRAERQSRTPKPVRVDPSYRVRGR